MLCYKQFACCSWVLTLKCKWTIYTLTIDKVFLVPLVRPKPQPFHGPQKVPDWDPTSVQEPPGFLQPLLRVHCRGHIPILTLDITKSDWMWVIDPHNVILVDFHSCYPSLYSHGFIILLHLKIPWLDTQLPTYTYKYCASRCHLSCTLLWKNCKRKHSPNLKSPFSIL